MHSSTRRDVSLFRVICANLHVWKKDVTVVGLLDHAEIWDTEKWNEYNGSIDAESISADMEGIDF